MTFSFQPLSLAEAHRRRRPQPFYARPALQSEAERAQIVEDEEVEA